MYANIFVVMGVSMEKISYEKFVKLVNSFDEFNEKLLFALYEKYGKGVWNRLCFMGKKCHRHIPVA